MEETEYYVEEEEDPRMEEMEERLKKLETEQQKMTVLIKKLLEFHCSQQRRSTEACLSMFA